MKFASSYILWIICLIPASISCTKPVCECDFIPVDFIEFKLINHQGQNLLIGSSALYLTDSIKISKEKNNIYIDNASVRKGLTDSTAIQLNFYVPEAKSYIYYNYHTPQDSIEIKWLIKKGKCCGSFQEYKVIESVKFNTVLIKPIDGIYYFLQ